MADDVAFGHPNMNSAVELAGRRRYLAEKQAIVDARNHLVQIVVRGVCMVVIRIRGYHGHARALPWFILRTSADSRCR